MLLQFSLTNFKNFKETASLDLTEAKITEFTNHLLTDSEDSLSVLPIASIYGPNGSGKSNFLQGLYHLQQLVLDAPSAMKEDCYFLFDKTCKSQPTEYEIQFRVDKYEYDYQLKIQNHHVVEENLFGRHLSQSSYDVLFDRDNEGVYLFPAWEDTNVSSLTERLPFLYFLGIKRKDTAITRILHFFQNIIFFPTKENYMDLLTQVLKQKDLRKSLLSHLENLQLPITDLRYYRGNFFFTETKNQLSFEYSLEQASFGTQYLIYLLAALLLGRKNGTLLLIKHPEIYLHPKVLGYLIQVVTDSSSNLEGCQLLTVTHENSTMNNSLFRRDELWLTTPLEDGSSSLYTLALYPKENGEKVRKDETYFKQYLEGRYGACPLI